MEWLDEIFDESYHYDHKKIDSLSNTLGEIANDIRNDKYYSIDKHPKREVVEKGLADVFGFKKMNVTSAAVGGDNPLSVNAYTSSGYMDSESEEKNGHIKNVGSIDRMTVYVTRTLFADKTDPLTGREIMAIILHELGHFFVMTESKIKTRKVAALSAIFTLNFGLYKWLKKQSDPDFIKKYADSEDEYVNNVRAFDDGAAKAGVEIVDKITGDKSDTKTKEPDVKSTDSMSAIKEKFAEFVNGVNKKIVTIVDTVFGKDNGLSVDISDPMLKSVYGRPLRTTLDHEQQVEKDADAFAASFGYGPELVTSIMKMMHDPRLKVLAQNIKSIIKVDNMITGQYWEDIDRWLETTDHDSGKNRAKSILDNLKKYKDEPGLSKKDKADITKQIASMEKAIRVMDGFSRSDVKSLIDAGKDAVEKAKKDRK